MTVKTPYSIKTRQISQGEDLDRPGADIQVAFRYRNHGLLVELTYAEAQDLARQLDQLIFDDFIVQNGVDLSTEPF